MAVRGILSASDGEGCLSGLSLELSLGGGTGAAACKPATNTLRAAALSLPQHEQNAGYVQWIGSFAGRKWPLTCSFGWAVEDSNL